jgi:hypothetical protein
MNKLVAMLFWTPARKQSSVSIPAANTTSQFFCHQFFCPNPFATARSALLRPYKGSSKVRFPNRGLQRDRHVLDRKMATIRRVTTPSITGIAAGCIFFAPQNPSLY